MSYPVLVQSEVKGGDTISLVGKELSTMVRQDLLRWTIYADSLFDEGYDVFSRRDMVVVLASNNKSRVIIQYPYGIARRIQRDGLDIDLPHAVWMHPFEESSSPSDRFPFGQYPESDQDPVNGHVTDVA